MNFQERIEAGVWFDRSSLPPHRTSLGELSPDAQELRFCRDRTSHRGIGRFQNLRRLWLYSVDQEFLEELAEISTIELLFIDGITARDLSPLHKLRRLRRLIINGGTKVQNLDWVSGLPPLEVFAIENFKRVLDLDPLASLTTLTALGIEGSIWTRMRVTSLAPLSRLPGLRFLFLTNLTAADRSLCPLQSLINLEVLQIGALFPDEELVRLQQALPRLRCDWFDLIERYGSTRVATRAVVNEAGGFA